MSTSGKKMPVDYVAGPNDPKPKIPQVWGLAFITVYVLLLAVTVLLLFYWKNLYENSQTQQIACPLAKYCKEGDSNDGSLYSASIYFPTSFGDYTNSEIISFPYYDNYNYPVKKTLTVTFNKSDNVPSSGTRYQGKTNIGVSGTFPNYTLYIGGYSSRENIRSPMASLFSWAIKSGDTVMRKRAFMRVNSLVPLASGSGVTYLSYSIVVSGINENAEDLVISSSNSSSVVISGTDSVSFSPSQLTKSENYVNVYGDYNFVNREIVSRGLLSADEQESDKYNYCVDPGFISESCIGLAYNPESGKWYNPDGDPENPPPSFGSTWSDFADTDEKNAVNWCSFHLSPTSGDLYPDTVEGNNFLYQMSQVSDDIMDNVLVDPEIYSDLKWEYQGNTVEDKEGAYVQSIVFCGGPTEDSVNFVENDRSNTYNARYPNKDTRESNYTNVGF